MLFNAGALGPLAWLGIGGVYNYKENVEEIVVTVENDDDQEQNQTEKKTVEVAQNVIAPKTEERLPDDSDDDEKGYGSYYSSYPRYADDDVCRAWDSREQNSLPPQTGDPGNIQNVFEAYVK